MALSLSKRHLGRNCSERGCCWQSGNVLSYKIMKLASHGFMHARSHSVPRVEVWDSLLFTTALKPKDWHFTHCSPNQNSQEDTNRDRWHLNRQWIISQDRNSKLTKPTSFIIVGMLVWPYCLILYSKSAYSENIFCNKIQLLSHSQEVYKWERHLLNCLQQCPPFTNL